MAHTIFFLNLTVTQTISCSGVIANTNTNNYKCVQTNTNVNRYQRPARFSFLENSREFFFIFTSRSRSRAVSISLSLLEKEWRDFIFHFSLLEKSESYRYFTLFSREKRVKLGPGYNLTSIFVPNCISKDSQISSKHKPQNIGQISVLKSWPTPMLHVCTNLQHKKITRNSALISWPNFSFSTKLSFICSSSVATLTTVAASTSFQLAFLHIRVSSVKCGTDWQTRQCNDRTWIW